MSQRKNKSINSENILQKSKEINGIIVRDNFYSNVLNNDRMIDIYLPPSYETHKDSSYPVIYMHDGSNLFDPDLASSDTDWKIEKTVEKLVSQNKVEEVIVVGIHSDNNRDYEYTWVAMEENGEKKGGGGDKYAEFVATELKPFIDRNYRTLKDRENTAVIGSSFGGLISLYLGLHYPDVFSKIGAMSASLWWADGIIIEHLSTIRGNLKIWFDIGTEEDMSRKLFINLKELLISKGYIEGKEFIYFEDKGAEHNEYNWAKRFHLPLLFFFGKSLN